MQEGMMDKHLIRDRFERSFKSHADATVVQPDMAKELVRPIRSVRAQAGRETFAPG